MSDQHTDIRRLEAELGIDIYPGTEIMYVLGPTLLLDNNRVPWLPSISSPLSARANAFYCRTDVAGVEFVKGSAGVLVPQPSNDAADPLNWSPLWKTGALTCAVLLGFLQGTFSRTRKEGWSPADIFPRAGFGPLSLSSQIPYYIGEFGDTVEEVINYIGVTILVLGFSNFVRHSRPPCD